MSDNYITLPSDAINTGKLMRTIQLSVSGQNTQQEIVCIGDWQTNTLAGVDASGNLKVNVSAGSAGNAAASATGAAVPASADYFGINIAGNLVGLTGISLTNAKAATVAIVDGSGNQITSFGGGTQFADNAASGATPTGTLAMGWDSANSKVRALKVDTSQNLFVNISNASIAVTGTFWQTTQPVSLASTTITGTVAVTQSTNPWTDNISQFGGSNVVTGIGTGGAGIPRVTVSSDSFPATQPISGTISVSNLPSLGPQSSGNSTSVVLAGDQQIVVNLRDSVGEDLYGTNNALNVHLAGNEIFNLDGSGNLGVLQNGLWNVNQAIGVAGFEKLTDGINVVPVKASSTASVAADPSLVVALSPNSPLPAGTNILGSVVSQPTLYYSSLVLADASGNNWVTIMTDQGVLQTTQTTSSPTAALILNDFSAQASWSISVSGGILAATPVTYSPIYPSIIGWITPSNLQSILFINNGIFISRTPGRPQQISGAVSISNFPTGPQLSATSIPVVLAGDQQVVFNLRDSVGEDIYGTNNALNVHLIGNELFNIDGSGNLGVNIQGTVPVSASTALPVTVLAASLSANAAQETGGNLAVIQSQTQFMPTMPDLLQQILAQLRMLNLNFVASTNTPQTDNLEIQLDTFIQQ